jgi:hypothetical protein
MEAEADLSAGGGTEQDSKPQAESLAVLLECGCGCLNTLSRCWPLLHALFDTMQRQPGSLTPFTAQLITAAAACDILLLLAYLLSSPRHVQSDHT